MKHAIENKTVLVAGMGKSGLAARDLLLANGAKIVATDEKPRTDLGFEVLPQNEAAFTSADLIVLSPGVPTDAPPVEAARAKGIPIIGEVELASYSLRGPVIGITGSNGKTTTTALIGHILLESGVSNQVGGNIGTPPTAMVAASRDNQWNVLELSSYQLETIDEFQAQIAVCTNVTPDHLDRHHTFENYAAAKARLFETQSEQAATVLNADDPTCVSYASHTKAAVHWFSRKGLCGSLLTVEGQKLLKAAELPIRGAHNVENALAAASAAYLAGVPLDAIAKALRTFPGVEHRLEFVLERNGVQWYNDSKATNVDATEKAIDAFEANLWIVLGGKDRNSDYTVLREKLRSKAKGVLLIGAATPIIAKQLAGLPLVELGTIERAVEHAAERASSGDTVLLAPACASFDQFTSYEHRGRVFKELVRNL